MPGTMIRLAGVTKSFGSVVAVRDTSLAVERGEVVALLGPSGCGKTTFLRLVAGFERPDSGVVEIAERVVAGSETWVPPEERRVGMVFQDYALFPHLTVAGNVGFGLPRRQRKQRVTELLAVVGLESLEHRYPHELSGGQQQRVALARALAPAPEIVLLDEPWSNVDPFLRESLRAEVAEIIRPLGVTAILVTHDREEAFSLADRVALMRSGEIVQDGSAEELYFAPATSWAAEFVGAANLLPGRIADGLVTTAVGTFPAVGANGDSEVEVLLRPELIELAPDPAGAARVVAREFRGHDVFYRIALDGTELVSQRPSNEVVPLGSRVSIHIHEGRTHLVRRG
jgi:iron(III) transport system ATP-binding protein